MLIDYDYTLTAADRTLTAEGESFVAACKAVWGDRTCIYSDSAGTPWDRSGELAASLESSLGVPVIRHHQDKPGGIREVRAHFGDRLGRLAVVGDRLLTDVAFAKRYGFYPVWLRHPEPLGLWERLERLIA